MTAPAIDGPQHELVQQQRDQREQALFEQRLGAGQQVQPDRQIGDERQRQRVLAELLALNNVERQTESKADEDASGARSPRRPIQHGHDQQRWPDHRQQVRQRHQRQQQGCHGRAIDQPAGNARRAKIHGGVASGLVSSAAGSDSAASLGAPSVTCGRGGGAGRGQ